MAQSRKTALKSAAFDKNVTKRGKVPQSLVKKPKAYPVGVWTIALFVFLVIGSAVFQIISTAQRGASF